MPSIINAQQASSTASMPIPLADARAGKYLTFRLGAEDFGIQVLKVREISGTQQITAVPNVPPYVRGVVNLRGRIIPVVDLRLKFELAAVEYTQRTCTIVVQLQRAESAVFVGVIVDEVSEVANIASEEIEDTPHFGESIEVPYILGMAKSKGGVKILLDIDQILSKQDFSSIKDLIRVGEEARA